YRHMPMNCQNPFMEATVGNSSMILRYYINAESAEPLIGGMERFLLAQITRIRLMYAANSPRLRKSQQPSIRSNPIAKITMAPDPKASSSPSSFNSSRAATYCSRISLKDNGCWQRRIGLGGRRAHRSGSSLPALSGVRATHQRG